MSQEGDSCVEREWFRYRDDTYTTEERSALFRRFATRAGWSAFGTGLEIASTHHME
jgi:hypothetical protein